MCLLDYVSCVIYNSNFCICPILLSLSKSNVNFIVSPFDFFSNSAAFIALDFNSPLSMAITLIFSTFFLSDSGTKMLILHILCIRLASSLHCFEQIKFGRAFSVFIFNIPLVTRIRLHRPCFFFDVITFLLRTTNLIQNPIQYPKFTIHFLEWYWFRFP
jgi:hypothetical protein